MLKKIVARDQKGATLIEYGLILGVLVVFVLVGMNALNTGFNDLLGVVESENQLQDKSNQAQAFTISEGYEADYYAWVAANGENANTAWLAFAEAEHPVEFSAWLNQQGGLNQPPNPQIDDLTAQQDGAGRVILRWTPKESPNRRKVRGYNIYIDEIKKGTAPPIAVAQGDPKISYLASNLQENTTYTFYIRPYNNFGEGQASNSISLTLTADATFKPGIPLNLAGTPKSGSVQLTWDPPSTDGGSPIESYQIEVGPANFVVGPSVRNVPVTQNSIDFTGLTNGKTYTFNVRSYNGQQYSEAAIITNAPFEPFSVANMAQGVQPYIYNTTGLTTAKVFSPESAIQDMQLPVSVPNSQLYRLHYQELWRQPSANPVHYVVRARLNDGTLIREHYGVLDGGAALKDSYITWDGLVVLPAGAQNIYLTLEQLNGTESLQGVRTPLSPGTFFFQDVSPGGVVESGNTGQTLSPLPEGVENYLFDTNSGGPQTISTSSGKVDLPGASVTVNPSESSSYVIGYSGEWVSSSSSEVVVYVYIDGVETDVIVREPIENRSETINGQIVVPSLSAGAHTIALKAQTLYGPSTYENTADSPMVIYAENVNGSDPVVRETQVDISKVPHGLKDQAVSTTPVSSISYPSSTQLVNNTLTFSNSTQGPTRSYLVGVSIPVNGGVGDSLTIEAKVNGGTTVRLVQDYFTSAPSTELFTGYTIVELPVGASSTTIEFFIRAADGNPISIGASTAQPIRTWVVDVGDS